MAKSSLNAKGAPLRRLWVVLWNATHGRRTAEGIRLQLNQAGQCVLKWHTHRPSAVLLISHQPPPSYRCCFVSNGTHKPFTLWQSTWRKMEMTLLHTSSHAGFTPAWDSGWVWAKIHLLRQCSKHAHGQTSIHTSIHMQDGDPWLDFCSYDHILF